MEHPLVSVGNLKILFWVDPPQGGYNFGKTKKIQTVPIWPPYQEMYPSRFFVATTLPDVGNQKIAHHNTRFWSPKKLILTLFPPKFLHPSRCLFKVFGRVFLWHKNGSKSRHFLMPFLDEFVKKINILDNIDRSSVCLLIAVIFAPFVGGAKTVRDLFAAPFAHF